MTKPRREFEENMLKPLTMGGKCCPSSRHYGPSPPVLISFLAVILLATSVSGGTVPNRRGGVVGTDILSTGNDPKASRNMQPVHQAFLNAGKRKGLEIWRIENFEPVPYPAKDYGKFYVGDSYIILETKENRNGDLSWDIHFWLGSETSADEAGAAAIFTVQLDDHLKGDPVQHRETQDHESQSFLGYFKNADKNIIPCHWGRPPVAGLTGEEQLAIAFPPANLCCLAIYSISLLVWYIVDVIVENKEGGGDGDGSDGSGGGGGGEDKGDKAEEGEKSGEGGEEGKEGETPADGEKPADGTPADGPIPENQPEPPTEGVEPVEPVEPVKPVEPVDDPDRKPSGSEKGKPVPTEPENEAGYRIRRPYEAYRMPRYSAELLTPTKVVRGRHALSKQVSQVSCEKVSASKASSRDRLSLSHSTAAGKISSLISNSRENGNRSRSTNGSNKSTRNSSTVNFENPVVVDPVKIHTKSPAAPNVKMSSSDRPTTKQIPPMDDSAKTGGIPKKTSNKDKKIDSKPPPALLLQLPRGDGIRYEKGGVASGFQHAEVNAAGEKRLFQVKGKRNVRVRQVNLSISSMNKGDCFILDAGNNIYVYVGSSAKRIEKLKAISAANQIRDQDHHGRSRVHIIDDFSALLDKEEFFELLGSGSPDQVPDASVAEEDGAFETKDEREVTLYRVSDASGSLKVETIGQKPLRQDMLDSKDCFILDTGSGIYVWVGKGATQQEKTQAMTKAQGFLQLKKYPSWTHIQRVVESAEPAPFKQYFSTWRDYGMAHTRLIRAANDRDSIDIPDEEFDVSVFHALKKSGGRAIGFMPDNGDGQIEGIYRVKGVDLAEVTPEMYGILYGGESYLIKYHYENKRGGKGYIIYYWQGQECPVEKKAAAAIHAVRLDNELHGVAVLVRVVQGFEPRHFLKVFGGKMITFMGGHQEGLHKDTYNKEGDRLFRVRGTCREDVRADQRPVIASSLASDDVFVLETSDKVYLWKGVGASHFEKEIGFDIVQRLAPSKELIQMDEGSESHDFWGKLGGKGDYDKILDSVYRPFLEPRLFHCKILANGKFHVEEIHHFEQEDLDVDDIMILDGGDEIYIWIGDGSTEEEREKSIQVAHHYLRTDPSERNEHTVPLVKVRQGHEPRSFKRLFAQWDDDVWQAMPSYESVKQNVAQANRALVN